MTRRGADYFLALEMSIESSNFIRCKSPPTLDDASRAQESVFIYISMRHMRLRKSALNRKKCGVLLQK